MNRAVEIARKISKDLGKNWLSELKEINLYNTFAVIYRENLTISNANAIVAFIIYAFDPDSPWMDLRKDRYENKSKILSSLGFIEKSDLFKSLVNGSNEKVNDSILYYLEDLTNWRWPTIFSLMDYHSRMIRFANQKTEEEKKFDVEKKDGEKETLTEDYAIDKIAKVNQQKGELLQKAIESRKKADELLDEIRKEFVNTDHATQIDMGFAFTDTAKKPVDILSWRNFIRQRNLKKSIVVAEG